MVTFVGSSARGSAQATDGVRVDCSAMGDAVDDYNLQRDRQLSEAEAHFSAILPFYLLPRQA